MSAEAAESNKKKKIIKIGRSLLLILFVAAVLISSRYFKLDQRLKELETWLQSIRPWDGVVFVVIYAIGSMMFLPASMFNILAGALYGLAWGTAHAFIGATLGALAGFASSRYFGRDFINSWMGNRPKIKAVDSAIKEKGLKLTLLLRISITLPFGFMNYALGVSKVTLRDYALACFAMLPPIFLSVYVGHVFRDAIMIAGGAAEIGKNWTYYASLFSGLIATAVVTVYFVKIARNALKEIREKADNETSE